VTSIYRLEQIKEIVPRLDLAHDMAEGFVSYSRGQVVVPPVGELIFDEPPGDTHIKYGYIKGDDYFVVKIASGFYENHKLNLPSSSGLMLLFSQKSGKLESVLLDEGYLTNVRTAVAGQIVAKYFAPKRITGIGVFGTGIQARLQVEFLKPVTDCRQVVAWGRRTSDFASYKEEMGTKGFDVETTTDAGRVTAQCNLIVTATPSSTPLLTIDQLMPGTHITALGSDTPEKQELDSEILGRAELVVADSIEQCQSRGEIFRALKAGLLDKHKVVELGAVIADPSLGRSDDDQLTVADLTGVAVQDIQIAKAVHRALQAAGC
jgi:ornithine cyclodeaminase